MSLTKGICRKQANQVVIENYEAAVKVAWTAEEGVHPVGPATLARAKKQLAICRAELIRRGLPVDYKPELKPHEKSLAPRQWAPAMEASCVRCGVFFGKHTGEDHEFESQVFDSPVQPADETNDAVMPAKAKAEEAIRA